MKLHRIRSVAIALLSAACVLCGSIALAEPAGPVRVLAEQGAAGKPIPLPNADGSLKFIAFGDFGDGKQPQYELAAVMARLRERFDFKLAVTAGDNLYGSERPQDFVQKFEKPYKPLLDAGVKFHASLGNHDAREQRFYKLFNMDGKLYYSLKAPGHESVRFFFLDSTYPVPEQVKWLEGELDDADEDWKIAVFHHPLYSSAGRHGSDTKLREAIEPLFIRYDVSVAFTGHDHVYERVAPQHGIAYWVIGSGGRLARGDLSAKSPLTARGFDADLAFLAVEIDGDTMSFNAISRTDAIVDSGVLQRRMPQEGKP